MLCVEATTPLHAAAYETLFNKVEPANCNTRARQQEIELYFKEVERWMWSQPRDVRTAYEWAIGHIKSIIDNRLNVSEFGIKIAEASRTIPKPP